jgi:hypothetical protein
LPRRCRQNSAASAYRCSVTGSSRSRVYAPYGGQITDLEVDSTPADITADKHYGRQVAFLPVSLAPGEHTTITVDFRTRKGQSGNGSFSYTPGILEAANGSEIVSACD